jgi:aminopeptidase N
MSSVNHLGLPYSGVSMRILLSAVFAVSLLGLSACKAGQKEAEPIVAPVLTSEQARDEFTFARPQEARVAHVSLDLNLDFTAKEVAGTAALNIAAAKDAKEIVLDSDGLRIASVAGADGKPLQWAVGKSVKDKGEPLIVQLPAAPAEGPRRIVITYKSAPDAEALQWLAPEQTAGGKHPYLFSQGQAILNRSWIPTQDSPGIRQSWDARITAPAALKVVMSGIIQGEAEPAGEGRHRFAFRMDKPVAPYLIAIAAGNIEFRKLGRRSGVWTEPETMPAAAAELDDTEAMIDAAEGLYGEYRWGRYDMIVLPPSFPYGGMENPVMTFLTPTFIAGDRSLTGLVAHELAHSWSGNLVTYASWRDGWLNEGVTSYLENRISEKVFGEERAAQERALSFAAAEEAIEKSGAKSPLTALRTPEGTNPFDTDTSATYEKGALFLHTVETIVGRERFDPWLRSWFDSHAFQPATSEMFIADLRKNLIKGDAKLEAALMLDQWVYAPGLPANAIRPDPAVFAETDRAVAAYAAAGTIPAQAWGSWTTAERMRFMQELPKQRSAEQLANLDQALALSGSGNVEIRFLWLKLALGNRYDPAIPQAEEFLARVGRNRLVTPLYKVLSEQGAWGMKVARPLYQRTRAGYHSFTRGKVDEVMGGTG